MPHQLSRYLHDVECFGPVPSVGLSTRPGPTRRAFVKPNNLFQTSSFLLIAQVFKSHS